jgi:hypothetical protein
MRVIRQGGLIALINLMFSCSLLAQEQPTQDLWNTGAVGQVMPMDEITVVEQGVTLISERVWVDLFPGFGVVRSVFKFSNQTDMPIRLKIGYPVRGDFQTGIQALAHFDDARGLRISVDGQAVITRTEEGRSNGHDPNPYTYQVWDQTFPPDSATTITVESVVPTQLSRLTSGEQFATGNAFGISLQGAESWDGLIGHLQVLVRLNGGLMLANIRGLVPDSAFIGNLGHLQLDRTNLEPRPEDNMIVWYSGAAADYPFEKKVTPMLEPLRVSMDTFPVTAFNDPAFQQIRRNDFDLAAGGLTLAGILYFIMFFAPWVILIGFVVFMLRGKRKRRAVQQAADKQNG